MRAAFIAIAGIWFDVRFTRNGKVYFKLQDKRVNRKMLKKIKRIRHHG